MKNKKKILTCITVVLALFTIILGWSSTAIMPTVIAGIVGCFSYYLYKIKGKPTVMILLLFFAMALLYYTITLTNEQRISNLSMELQESEETETVEKVEESLEAKEDKETETGEIIENDEDSEKDIDSKEDKSNTEPIVITKEVIKYLEVEKPVKSTTTSTTTSTSKTQEQGSLTIETSPNTNNEKQNSTPTVTPNNGNTNLYYNPYGDPMGGYSGNNYYPNNNNYYGSNTVRISGEEEVIAGEEYTYTISGVTSISKSKLKVPANVSIENISGNKVTLYFEEGWSGTYSLGYGSATIKVEVYAE